MPFSLVSFGQKFRRRFDDCNGHEVTKKVESQTGGYVSFESKPKITHLPLCRDGASRSFFEPEEFEPGSSLSPKKQNLQVLAL